MPPAGAGPESRTVALALDPPTTVEGLSAIDFMVGSATVSVAVRGVPLPDDADRVADVAVGTAAVDAANVAVTWPAPTVTADGAQTTPGFELPIETTVPAGGAARASVTIPVAVAPPPTVVGLRRSAVTPGAASP